MEPQLSAAEEKFEQWRRRVGMIAAPVLAVIVWFLPLPALAPGAHHLLAVLAAVITLWVTEALPLAVTAMLGPAVCVVAGIAPARDVFRGFGDPVLFVFIGGFLLAEAMVHHGVNRRVAFNVLNLPLLSRSQGHLLCGFGLTTAAISMWISNTATTAMMMPIGLAILSETASANSDGQRSHHGRFATALMLVASFASSVGGVATPVGTPPNLIGIGIIERNLGVRPSFFEWMVFALPLAFVLVAAILAVLARSAAGEKISFDGEWLRRRKAALGTASRAEKNVGIAFVVTVFLWILPGAVLLTLGRDHFATIWLINHLPESVAALIGTALLFVLPVRTVAGWQSTLTWREAQRIDWGTILLFGGGLALGDLMFSTGLAKWIGEGLANLLDARTSLGLIALFTAVGIVVSETTSNAASATMVVPVAIAVAQAAGVSPIQPAIAATLGASMGFMLPVSTPPNAIVYGSGQVPLTRMMRYGIVLDVLGFVAIVSAAYWLVPLTLQR
jgi:sodium-dependent dicarboxylate transporter 2/3/5